MDFIPYGRQSIDQTDIDAVTKVLRSDWLTTGPAIGEFEDTLGAVTGVPTIAVANGTAALHCAYVAAGVDRSTDIVTTPMTFVATAATAMALGATITFADVSDDTLNLDPVAAESAMSNQTKVIAAVDFAGHPADLDPLRQIAHANEALLVEDAAHAIGGKYRDQPIGAVADLTTFSFHPVKTITTGEGGAVASPDRDLLMTAKRFRSHGLVRESEELRHPDTGGWHQEVQKLGLNYRLPDILAALGTSQLRRLPRFLERRTALVARYNTLLADLDGLRLPAQRDDVSPAWHLFAVRVLDGRRREIYDAMHRAQIGVQVHYIPVHRHPVFEDAGYRQGMCPVAEKAYEELLSLPLYPDLTDAQQDRVVAELAAALQ